MEASPASSQGVARALMTHIAGSMSRLTVEAFLAKKIQCVGRQAGFAQQCGLAQSPDGSTGYCTLPNSGSFRGSPVVGVPTFGPVTIARPSCSTPPIASLLETSHRMSLMRYLAPPGHSLSVSHLIAPFTARKNRSSVQASV